MSVHHRSIGLIAAALMLAAAAPAWSQSAYDYRPSGNTTVYTSPALGGGSPQGGAYGGGQGGGYAAVEPLPADAAGRVEVRLQALEEQIRRLTGQLEEAQHRIGVLTNTLERLQGDVDLRFQELGKASPAPAPAAATPAAGAATLPPAESGVMGATRPSAPLDAAATGRGGAALPPGSVKEQYDYAFNLVRTDYAQAEAALKEFIAKHPNDALAGNAQYWLGETYYVRSDFQQAAVAFLTVYQKHPKNAKAPDSLLKLSLSLAGLGKAAEACAALSKLSQDFPNAPAALTRRATAERGKLGCK